MGEKVKMVITKLITVAISITLWSCATVNPAKPPPWTADVETSFPKSDYIAQKGYGSDKKNAETDALSAISRYFSMSVSASAKETVSVTDQGSTSAIDSETFVNSQTKLFAVHYTEPWYNQSAKQWETVAYIDRGEAWEIFEPNLRQKTDAFSALYNEAEKQNDLFTKILLYIEASGLAVKEELPQQFYFADALNPLGASFFGDIRAMLSEIPAKIEKNKTNAAVYVECENDYDGSVYAAVASTFSNAKFPVAKEKSNSAYTCLAVIGENAQKLSAGTFYFPTVTITISGKNGVVASFNKTLDRVGASDAAVAKRRAYTVIANEIQKSFLRQILEG
jgi:hypothetical protein